MGELFLRGLHIDGARLPEGSYLKNIPALRGLTELTLKAPVTFLVGENGSGKSTLLEAIAREAGFSGEGGTFHYRVRTYAEDAPLEGALSLIRGIKRPRIGYFFRAETFFNVATASKNQYMGADYHSRSHGEGFMDFLAGFDGVGLYLMDEPEAALSPQRQLALLRHIALSAERGSQFIIVTHSPILLACPNAQILALTEDGISPCDYEDTESVRLTRLFLTRREAILRDLLDG